MASAKNLQQAASNYGSRFSETEGAAAAALVGAVLDYDRQAASVAADGNLTPQGKAAQIARLRQRAVENVAKFGSTAEAARKRLAFLEDVAARGGNIDDRGELKVPAVETNDSRGREIRDRALAMSPTERGNWHRNAIRTGRLEVVQALEDDPAGLVLTPEQVEQGRALRMQISPLAPRIVAAREAAAALEHLEGLAERVMGPEPATAPPPVADSESAMRARLQRGAV